MKPEPVFTSTSTPLDRFTVDVGGRHHLGDPNREAVAPAAPDRKPLTPDQHRAALATLVYYAMRCQNPKCRHSTVPCTGGPDTARFRNWPRFDSAECPVCLNGFVRQFKLVGPEVNAFAEETRRNAREQQDETKRLAAAAAARTGNKATAASAKGGRP